MSGRWRSSTRSPSREKCKSDKTPLTSAPYDPASRSRARPAVPSQQAFSRIREEPVLLELYTYWEGVRGAKDVPDRRDIDPTDMPRFILPHLVLTEIHDGPRLRLRLIGTEIVRQHRRDNTGRFCDE